MRLPDQSVDLKEFMRNKLSLTRGWDEVLSMDPPIVQIINKVSLSIPTLCTVSIVIASVQEEAFF